MDNQRREEMQKGLSKIYEEPNYPKKVTKLEPLDKAGKKKRSHKKYAPMQTEAKKEQEFGFKKATLQYSQVKLEEMITLAVLKGTRNSGSIKKMIHAPTLKLYAVKEIPLTNREVRIIVKEWISTWQSAQGEMNDNLCNVNGTFWNVPEGCVSVVMEHMNGGSLENLLESVGALPESVLLEITQSLLKCIKEIHTKMGVPHNFIAPSQVLLDQTGKIKLNLGIAQRLSLQQRRLSNNSLACHSNPPNSNDNSPFKYYYL